MKDNKKNKILLIISIVLSIAAMVAIIVISVMSNQQKTDFPDVDDGPGEEVDEKSLIFYNRDILNLAYNVDFSAVVLNNISTITFSEEEMKYSGENHSIEGDDNIYYDATIDVDSFGSYNEYSSYFDVKISDGRKYFVITRTDSLDDDFTYIYTAITREGGDKIFIIINGNDANADEFTKFVKGEINKELVEIISESLQTELEGIGE